MEANKCSSGKDVKWRRKVRSMLEPRKIQHVHRVTYNTARKITNNVRPPTNPILFPDDWSTAGNSDQRPNVAMHANTAPCVAVNSIIYKSDRSRQKVRVQKTLCQKCRVRSNNLSYKTYHQYARYYTARHSSRVVKKRGTLDLSNNSLFLVIISPPIRRLSISSPI